MAPLCLPLASSCTPSFICATLPNIDNATSMMLFRFDKALLEIVGVGQVKGASNQHLPTYSTI